MGIVRVGAPQLVDFGPEYPALRGLLANNQELTRRLLAHLPRADWDSIAGFVRLRLTDSVIDAAVRRMPEPWWRASGLMVATALKRRRDQVEAMATRLYAWLR